MPNPHPPTPLQASPRQVHDWLRDGSAILVDVREPDEHAREHIQTSRLLPLSSFDPAEAVHSAERGQKLILHCRTGRRSLDAATRAAPLAAANNVPLYNMTGGIEAWKQDSLPVQTNTSVARLSIMRQVQITAGSCVLLGSILAWLLHPALIIIPAFFGAGLLFAGASGTCGMAALLSRMPWNRAPPRPARTELTLPGSAPPLFLPAPRASPRARTPPPPAHRTRHSDTCLPPSVRTRP